MAESVEIRGATLVDLPAAAECHHRCLLETFAYRLRTIAVEIPDLRAAKGQLREWLAPGSGVELRVVTLDGALVGYCAVSDNRLVHLFVDPAHQGAGIGGRLLTEAESLLGAAGHRTLELHTRVENRNAIAFYEHAGWTTTERTIRTVEHGIAYQERVLIKTRRP